MNSRNMLVLIGVLVIVIIVTGGCSLLAPRIEIGERPLPIVCDTANRPDALELKDTPPTLVMNEGRVWGYWFDAELYAAIAENIQAMRRWMDQSNRIRETLVQCIELNNARAAASDATLGRNPEAGHE